MKEERGRGEVDVICREISALFKLRQGGREGGGWMLYILISQGYLGSFTLVTLV